jgi:hypothetical protein
MFREIASFGFGFDSRDRFAMLDRFQVRDFSEEGSAGSDGSLPPILFCLFRSRLGSAPCVGREKALDVILESSCFLLQLNLEQMSLLSTERSLRTIWNGLQ